MADEQHEALEDGDPNDLQAEPVMERDTDGSQPAESVVEPESDGPTPSELGIEQFLGDEDGAAETNSGSSSDAGGDCNLPGWDLERELEKILQDDDDEIQPILNEIMSEPPPAPPPEPDEAAEPPPPPPPEPDEAPQQIVRERGQYLYFEVRQGGTYFGDIFLKDPLRYEDHPSLNAHCKHHEIKALGGGYIAVKCHCDRRRLPGEGAYKSQGRPLGLLALWLRRQQEVDRQQHASFGYKRGLGRKAELPARRAARAWLKVVCSDLFHLNVERAKEDGEDSEPEIVL